MLIPGAMIGALVASRVQMTAMPQLVAILHSFVGAAAVLVGFATYLGDHEVAEAEKLIHLAEIFIGVCIGSITFTGSVIAFAQIAGNDFGTTASDSRKTFYKSFVVNRNCCARCMVYKRARS